MYNQVVIVTVIKHKHQPPLVNSPFLLQHVYYEPVYPTSFDQIPHHASKMSGGMQQLIFSMLIQVFISGSMYLHDRAQKQFELLWMLQMYKSSSYFWYIFVTHKLSPSLFSVQIIQ